MLGIMENITGIKISAAIDGMKLKNSDRMKLTVMLHDVVFENQRAIFDLVHLGHLGPASALLRVLFEAHVKSIWLYDCATDKQIAQFKKDKIKLKFKDFISQIETKMPHLNGTLSKFKSNHWDGLNSLTHSGAKQFSYEFTNEEMIRQYSDDYPQALLDFSERFAILSLHSLGIIIGDTNIINCYNKLTAERLR
ncbi:MAG: hypothetical protein ACJA2G_003126 [Cognaticolwellia sp.]|jgi:hypothetical protein